VIGYLPYMLEKILDMAATKDPTLRKDPSNFETYMKNVYRVLLTRGMKGCYVYFTDKDSENYFKERIEK
jgi:uncharacterized protein